MVYATVENMSMWRVCNVHTLLHAAVFRRTGVHAAYLDYLFWLYRQLVCFGGGYYNPSELGTPCRSHTVKAGHVAH